MNANRTINRTMHISGLSKRIGLFHIATTRQQSDTYTMRFYFGANMINAIEFKTYAEAKAHFDKFNS